MDKTIERYQGYSYGKLEASQQTPKETQSSHEDFLKLKAKVNVLQRTQRNLLGEDLENLGTMQLDQLERQLDTTLKQTRLRKDQVILDQLYNLHRKLEEMSEGFQSSWEVDHAQPASHFIEPLQCNSALQIGYNNDEANIATSTQNFYSMAGCFDI
uniref:MADS60 n=1 Tax=Hippophae rhamnoides TaxID=193516 RepID=A0AAU7LJI2_9ROSA